MIKDNLSRASIYYDLSDSIKTGFEWIKNHNLKNMHDGRYEISDKIYANIQTYETKDNAPYEAHQKYIDIQYMITGEELAGVTDYNNCSVIENYNEEKDIEFLVCNEEEHFYRLKEGEFFLFFPHDAHKPAIKTNTNKTVKKVIVKVS